MEFSIGKLQWSIREQVILQVMSCYDTRSIQNTLIYTQMVQFKKEEYASATAKTIEDAQKLVELGFEYVTEIDGVKLFRKAKMNKQSQLIFF